MLREKQFLQQIVQRFMCSIYLLLLIPLIVTAQENIQTYTFSDNKTTITYDNSWTLTANDDGSVILTNGSLNVTLYESAYVSNHVQVNDSSMASDILEAMHNALLADSQVRFDPDRVVEHSLGRRIILIYPYVPEDEDMLGLFAILQLSDGSYGFANILSPADSIEEDQQVIFRLLNTFDNASCMVSTDQEQTVELRVGPGFNRGVNTFMPTNQEFTVLGQATVDDVVWWKLDKVEVAPQSAAAELWVAAVDVTASPGCETVTTAPIPTVRPFPTAGNVSTEASSTSFNPLCPGTTSSEFMVAAWNATDINFVSACVANLQTWENEARAQQAARVASGECNTQPNPDELNSYFASNWALADVATGYYILGLRAQTTGELNQARQAFNTVINSYSCAWAWDPRGWFWSLKQAATEQMP